MRVFQVIRIVAVGLSLASAAAPGAALARVIPIHTFNGSDGQQPQQIVAGKDGSLYGVTFYGGTAGQGTVFRLDPPVSGKKWKLKTLHSFSGGNGGANPVGIALADGGEIYGTTTNGGRADGDCSGGCGIVFELTASDWKFVPVHLFQGNQGKDGKWPMAEPALHNNALYVTTEFGGTSGAGTVSAFDPPPSGGKNWTTRIVYSFADEADGYELRSPVTFVGNTMFGTTFNGGGQSYGTVFGLFPVGALHWQKQTIADLYGALGGGPKAQLLYRKGALYGTNSFAGGPGGGGSGVVFKLADSGSSWDYTALHAFSGGADGDSPVTLTFAPSGNVLYGITEYGGANSEGTLYKHLPKGAHWRKKTLWSFTGQADGAQPRGLVFGADGTLYGTTESGGQGRGVVYKLRE